MIIAMYERMTNVVTAYHKRRSQTRPLLRGKKKVRNEALTIQRQLQKQIMLAKLCFSVNSVLAMRTSNPAAVVGGGIKPAAIRISSNRSACPTVYKVPSAISKR